MIFHTLFHLIKIILKNLELSSSKALAASLRDQVQQRH